MDEPLSVFIRAAALAVATLLPVINPAGMAPIFLSLTGGTTDRQRALGAARAARGAFLLLTVAMIGGSSVLLFFGLTLADIRIAGGLLVTATAWQLMRTDRTVAGREMAPLETAERPVHAGFYPLTFPVTIGPGSLAIAVTLGATPPAALLGAVAGAAVMSIAVFLCYRFAARVAKMLGDAGTLVLLRLSGFILLSVGVKIVCDGIVERFVTGSA